MDNLEIMQRFGRARAQVRLEELAEVGDKFVNYV
jgi:hypothetical protein